MVEYGVRVPHRVQSNCVSPTLAGGLPCGGMKASESLTW